mmetsp:Transcript_29942/g.74818  ORF Transcript_29942/g.74818 Transcript_29942/m.74818 type:complete len:264 (-) Transcript_29942:578-1369(-)
MRVRGSAAGGCRRRGRRPLFVLPVLRGRRLARPHAVDGRPQGGSRAPSLRADDSGRGAPSRSWRGASRHQARELLPHRVRGRPAGRPRPRGALRVAGSCRQRAAPLFGVGGIGELRRPRGVGSGAAGSLQLAQELRRLPSGHLVAWHLPLHHAEQHDAPRQGGAPGRLEVRLARAVLSLRRLVRRPASRAIRQEVHPLHLSPGAAGVDARHRPEKAAFRGRVGDFCLARRGRRRRPHGVAIRTCCALRLAGERLPGAAVGIGA